MRLPYEDASCLFSAMHLQIIKRATRENDGRFLQHMVNSTTKHKDLYTGKYWSKILGGAYVN